MSEIKDYWFLFIYIPIYHVLQKDNVSIKKQENTDLKNESTHREMSNRKHSKA